MFINHNISSMNAQRHVFNTNKSMDKTLERLASGLKINSGADDASGLAISEKMNAQNAGLLVANQNAQDGQALYKIAEGALTQVSSMLTRMEELGVRATNGTLTESDRIAVTDEVDELRAQINQISSTTEYNTLKILNGSMAIESHISDDPANAGANGSMRIIDKPGTLKTGSSTIQITQLAQPAIIEGNPFFAPALAPGGLINVNGIEITIKPDSTISAVAAKINEVNDQAGVIAVVSAAGNEMALITGTLDQDAENIDPTDTDVIGYANMGSKESIRITGDPILINFGMGLAGAAVTAYGVDAAGNIDGVDMKSHGTSLEDNQAGSDSYGAIIETDLFNGGNGVYIKNGQNTAVNSIIHRSAVNDEAAVVFDITDRLRLQVGANTNQSIYNGIENISTAQLGIGGSSKYGSLDDINLDTTDNANISLKVIQQAIEDVTKLRSKIGATMNRLDYTVQTLSIQRENLTAAQSRIQDADISAEMTAFTKQQIMLQTGTAMLSQANARPQSVLQLLQ